MTTDSVAIGERIARARENAGLTQQNLSHESGIPRTALAKIERGIRGVGAMELASIARALGMRLEWLLESEPRAVVSYRTGAGADVTLATINTQLERVARDVELVLELDPQITFETFNSPGTPRTNQEAENLAAFARQVCGVGPDEPIVDLVGVVARAGLFAFSEELGGDTADAGSLLLERGAVALVNSSHDVGRRRLSLAHELGHLLAEDEYTIDWRIADPTTTDATEISIDRFARSFLAPAAAIEHFWTTMVDRYPVRDAAVLAGSHFRVDMSTLARRLHELGLADGAALGAVRAARTKQADIVEHRLIVPYDLEGTTVPSRYAQSVLKLYRQRRVSSERALGLLRGTFDADGLPEIPMGSENEIWKLID